jgi:hypothetical protein
VERIDFPFSVIFSVDIRSGLIPPVASCIAICSAMAQQASDYVEGIWG